MSKEQFSSEQIAHEKMVKKHMLRYQNNRISYLLSLLGLAVGVAAFCTIYGFIVEITFLTGVDILLNILIMLFIFMAAENMKTYRDKWSYVSIGLGVLQVARFFFYPFQLYNSNLSTGGKVLDISHFVIDLILILIAAALLIAAGVISIFKCRTLKQVLKDEGAERR